MCADVDMMKTDFELFLPLLRSTTAADFAEVLGLLRMMYTSYGEVRQVCLSAMMFLYVSCTNSGRPPVLVSNICFAANTSSFVASGMPGLGLYWHWPGFRDFEPSGLGFSGGLE